MHNGIRLQSMRRKLRKLDGFEMNELITYIIQDYSIKFPNDEIIFLSLPKDDLQERRRVLEFFVDFVGNCECK